MSSLRNVIRVLPGFFAVYSFVAIAVALIAHKCFILSIHGPYSRFEEVVFGPGTFCLDFLTLFLLYHVSGLTSRVWKVLAVFIGVLIIICSAVSASVYVETNAEVRWGRSLEVPFLRSENANLRY